jgi:hypothetical protein
MRLLLTVMMSLLLMGCAQQQQDTSGMEGKIQELEEKVESLEEQMEEVEERIETIEEEVESMNNVTPPIEADDTTAPVPKGMTRFTVTVKNVHDTQTLSPGIFAVHKPLFSLNYVGKLAPAELEPLAEYGDYKEFVDYVNNSADVQYVYILDEPIQPGEDFTFTMDVSTYMPRESYLSGILMATGSNDGYALASNIALFDPGNGPKGSTTDCLNYDAGTEQNSPLMSGFEGGQPDPSKGQENIDNGEPTSPQLPVTHHTQLTKTIMKVIVTPYS